MTKLFTFPCRRIARTDAVKVALASCEFPMVQWTIEDEWNRLYTNEGIALDTTERAFLTFVHSSMQAPVCIRLPIRVNPVSVVRRGEWLVVTCEHPHGAGALTSLGARRDCHVRMTLIGGVDGSLPAPTGAGGDHRRENSANKDASFAQEHP